MMTITALIICILVIPTQTTVLERDTTMEFLLAKVAELERNQQEYINYQNYAKVKLQQSERRISELEAIIDNIMSDEYTENLSVAMENEPVDKSTNDTVTTVIKENNTRLTQELKKMNSRKRGIVKREGIATKHIGFCATVSKGIVPVHEHDIILFDTVLQNEGNGFNKQTGVFTCPLSGSYFFSLSLLTQPGSPTYVHLIVNGQIKANSFAHGTTFSDQGSISIIVRCEAGQKVWIGVYGGTHIFGEHYTSFSGFFLWGDPTGSR